MVDFDNNWKQILNALKGLIGQTFAKKGLRVVIANVDDNDGKSYISLNPIGSTLSEQSSQMEIREFSIDISYHYTGRKKINKTELDSIFLIVSELEALIHENIVLTLADNTSAFNCRMESCDLNTSDEDVDNYVVSWDWKCSHAGNIA